MRKISDMFKQEIKVINIGLESFNEPYKEMNVKFVQVDWRPPAGGDKEALEALKKLMKK